MNNWISLSQTAGTGNAVITVSPSANPSAITRSATIKVSNGSITKTVYVSQRAAELKVDRIEIVGHDYYAIPYAGGTATTNNYRFNVRAYFNDGTSRDQVPATITGDTVTASTTMNISDTPETAGTIHAIATFSGKSATTNVTVLQQPVPETNRIAYSASTPILFTNDAINNFGANIITSGYSNGSGVYIFDNQVARFYGNASCMITPATKGALTEITVPSSIVNLGQSVFNGCSALTSVYGLEYTENVYLPPENSGNDAFRNCTSLTHCGLPHSYQYWSGGAIKADVFNGCSSLTTIIYNGTMAEWNAISKNSNWRRNSAVRYVQCTDGTIDLDPSQNDTITYYATEQLNIPDSATTPSIISHTFSNGVGTIKASGDITVWGNTDSVCESNSGLTAIILPSTIERIGTRAFKNCTSLSACTIPESLKTMGVEAFENTQITEVTIPSGFTKFDYWAGSTWHNYGAQFQGCSGITSINIQSTQIPVMTNYLFYWYLRNNLTINYSGTISQWLSMSFSPSWTYTFGGNYSVRYVQCLDGLIDLKNVNKTIYYYAPAKLPEVTEKTYPDYDTGLNINGFTPALASSGHTFENGVGTLTFPSAVTKIGNYTFAGCSGMTDVLIPDNVSDMNADGIFHNCSSLSAVTLPSGLTIIDTYMFSNCLALVDVYLPTELTEIKTRAFYISSFGRQTALNLHYPKTMSDWNNITLASDWIYSSHSYPIYVICSDGTITL